MLCSGIVTESLGSFRRRARGQHSRRLRLVQGNDTGGFRGRQPLASHALELEYFCLQHLSLALQLSELLLSSQDAHDRSGFGTVVN